MNRSIFTFWLGPSEMSTNRIQALWSIFNSTCCPVSYITSNTLDQWLDKKNNLHPAFEYLSPVHQADYLRCYVMHHFGGGYTDIKPTWRNWRPFFDSVEKSASYGAGYTEISPQGVAKVGGDLQVEMERNFEKIIGYCAFIFKAKTLFTEEWLELTNQLLDHKLKDLKSNPARHPMDQTDFQFLDGSISGYPLKWTELGGNIFHPLAYRNHQKLIKIPMNPNFINYR